MTKRDQAISEIRRIILAGKVPLGIRTSERVFTEEYLADTGLGRTPVREGLAVLALQGLINQFPQVGFEVRRVEADEVTKDLQLQCSMEAVILAEAARAGVKLDLLADHVDRMRRATKDGEPAEFMRHATDFHVDLALLADFSGVADTLSGFCDGFQLYLLGTKQLEQHEMEELVPLHQEILDALSTDSEGAHATEQLDRLIRTQLQLVADRANPQPASSPSPRHHLRPSQSVGAELVR